MLVVCRDLTLKTELFLVSTNNYTLLCGRICFDPNTVSATQPHLHQWRLLNPDQPDTLAVSARQHPRLPFPAHMPPPAPPALEAEEEAEEDIEVDLGLQQALIQSIAPSPAMMHTKGNALHDISNWRLPTPAKKQGAGAGPSPLQALTGPKGDTHMQGNL